MSEAPRQDLRAELHRLEATNSTLLRRNKRLAEILAEARTQLQEIKLAVAHLGDPPNTYGTLIEVAPDKTTAEVVTAGRRMRLPLSPDLVINNQVRVDVRPGAQVRLNEGLVVVDVAGYLNHGEVASVKEVLADERRALVVDKTDEEFVIQLAAPLLPPHSPRPPRVGDIVLLDRRAGFAFEAIPKPEVEELILEEVPDVDYSDIGGLTAQITQIRDAVELPFTHPEAYAKFGLRPPKGVLLYGPPGCGKTLIAKAVANSLATQIAVARGADPADRKAARSYFLNVKGPELLNKYVGETERQIRLIFERAREKASAGTPVIIFFDEMDSIFRTRGSGVSSDMETTVVPQLLSELDGVEGLENVIVIGASNREEMIDPAILRPGRLDVKIRIDRPDQQAAREIFSKYLTAPLPLRAEDVLGHDTEEAYLAHLIEEVLEAMYTRSAANRFVELTYVDQTTEVLYFADFASGAMIANIVDRAKKHAIKDLIAGAGEGLRLEHLTAAVREEFAENEDLPNSANPDEWARISGRRGDQVVRVKTLTTPRNNQYTAE